MNGVASDGRHVHDEGGDIKHDEGGDIKHDEGGDKKDHEGGDKKDKTFDSIISMIPQKTLHNTT